MRAINPTRVALVVEDDALIRFDVVHELRSRGWDVFETSSGEEALEIMDNHHLDVVMTDIELAGVLTGWDVARAARNRWPALPVIYMSARAVEEADLVPASVFFQKPYDPAQVVEEVEQMLPSNDETDNS